MKIPEKLEVMIITLSDRAYRGDYKDLSGEVIKEILSEYLRSSGYKFNINMNLIPDNSEMLKELLTNAGSVYNIIITSGGTGIGPRDITVETVRPLLSKEIPGIMEFIRVKYGMEKPNALLSRGIAGILGKALIYTLPGSVKAVEEYMAEIMKTLKHTLDMQYGIDSHGNY
jgi:molybdenum cofactor synthesis domain-containing protein